MASGGGGARRKKGGQHEEHEEHVNHERWLVSYADMLTLLFVLFVVLFGVLVGATSWWSVLRAKPLQDNPYNRRPLLEAQRIPRGLIFAENGARLAVSRCSRSRRDIRSSRRPIRT